MALQDEDEEALMLLDGDDIASLMQLAVDGGRDELDAVLSSMTSEQVAFFEGYVNGYVHAVSHMREAEVEGGSGDGL